MKFKFDMPVKLIFGTGVIRENAEKFKIGKKALIVTGKNSARVCGALDDVIVVLESIRTDYVIFDDVINNPSLDNVAAGAELGKKSDADFVIAIGGGSPLDAAKAIAALCTNNIEAISLIGNIPANKSLPIIAIPTTSGTGSEVTPYSILTVPSMKTKKNFFSPDSFPVYAFADPRYTYSLPYKVTIDTVFDAFSHLLESYFSLKSTPYNDSIVIEGITAWAGSMESIINNNLTEKARELQMYASCLGGIAITHTGTTLIHAMGYSLTYFRKFTHGRANAMIIGEYLRLNQDVLPEKTDKVLGLLGFKDINDAEKFFTLGLNEKPILSEDECRLYAGLAMGQGSVKMNPRKVDEEDIFNLYKKIFGGAR